MPTMAFICILVLCPDEARECYDLIIKCTQRLMCLRLGDSPVALTVSNATFRRWSLMKESYVIGEMPLKGLLISDFLIFLLLLGCHEEQPP